MHLHLHHWLPQLRGIVLAAAVAAAPMPVLAGEANPSTQPGPGIRASVQKVVAGETQAVAAHARAAQTASAPADRGSASFFKTPVGIVVLAALAVGVGYALYSTQNDRITSPAKE